MKEQAPATEIEVPKGEQPHSLQLRRLAGLSKEIEELADKLKGLKSEQRGMEERIVVLMDEAKAEAVRTRSNVFKVLQTPEKETVKYKGLLQAVLEKLGKQAQQLADSLKGAYTSVTGGRRYISVEPRESVEECLKHGLAFERMVDVLTEQGVVRRAGRAVGRGLGWLVGKIRSSLGGMRRANDELEKHIKESGDKGRWGWHP